MVVPLIGREHAADCSRPPTVRFALHGCRGGPDEQSARCVRLRGCRLRGFGRRSVLGLRKLRVEPHDHALQRTAPTDDAACSSRTSSAEPGSKCGAARATRTSSRTRSSRRASTLAADVFHTENSPALRRSPSAGCSLRSTRRRSPSPRRSDNSPARDWVGSLGPCVGDGLQHERDLGPRSCRRICSTSSRPPGRGSSLYAPSETDFQPSDHRRS